MPRRLSDALGVASRDLDQLGVFDAFVDIDSRFHIDPHLLEASDAAELAESHRRFLAHFENVLRLVKASRSRGDRFHREAVDRLTFREFPPLALGYSASGIAGSGVGSSLAVRLADTAREIVDAGIEDPAIFELVGLFEEGFGADRISDMAAAIGLPDILDYTQRISRELDLPTRELSAAGATYRLPMDEASESTLVLLPRDILRPLPMAYEWSDVEVVASHNSEVRRSVNRIIGNTWRQAVTRVHKSQLKRTLLRHPELIQDLLRQYKEKPATKYDFAADPAGEFIWREIGQEFASQFPLALAQRGSVTREEIFEVVTTICEHFSTLIEENGLSEMLYDSSGNRRSERFAQLLFFAVADSYCSANQLDLSREPNAGRGPVDFKISRGYPARVTVEIKYSSNSHLVSGFERQLPAYNAAERTDHSIYLIVRTTESVRGINRLVRLARDAEGRRLRVPKILVADGRLRPSASRL